MSIPNQIYCLNRRNPLINDGRDGITYEDFSFICLCYTIVWCQLRVLEKMSHGFLAWKCICVLSKWARYSMLLYNIKFGNFRVGNWARNAANDCLTCSKRKETHTHNVSLWDGLSPPWENKHKNTDRTKTFIHTYTLKTVFFSWSFLWTMV